MAITSDSKRTSTRGSQDPTMPIAWVPKSPDGGWGWVVVFGSLLIHVLTDGIVYSFGIMVVEFLDAFNEGRSLTSWIISILVGMTLGTGPIASAVTNRFGCRVATIAGAIIASLGCFACYFATSILYLMISVGLVVGFGFGLIYCPAIIIVSMYFEERRSLATGLAVCGAGIGTFIFAPLSSFLIEEYTWRGAFLIYSGLVLNCAVCGALFRPLEFVPVYEIDEQLKMLSEEDLCVIYAQDEEEDAQAEENHKLLMPIMANGTAGATASLDTLTKPAKHARVLALSNEDPKQGSLDTVAKNSKHARLRAVTAAPDPTYWREKRSNTITGGLEESIQLRKSLLATRQRIKGVSESHGYLNIPDVFYFGSITSMPTSRRQQVYHSMTVLPHKAMGAILERTDSEGHLRIIVSRPPSPVESETPPTSACEKLVGNLLGCVSDVKDVLERMISISLLKDPLFIIFVISNFLTSIALNAPLIFLPDKATHILKVSSQDSSWLLSSYGLFNTIGRVIFGYFSDRTLPCRYGKNIQANRLWIYNISLTSCGIFTLFSFVCLDYVSMMVYSALYGFTISTYICLTSVILVDLLGIDKLTNAFGLLLLFEGIASVLGPPIAGWIVDYSGSFDYAFYFAGVCLALSGIILYCIPCFIKRRKKSQGNNYSNNDA